MVTLAEYQASFEELEEEEEEEKEVYLGENMEEVDEGPDEGETLVIRRALSGFTTQDDMEQREAIFHTRCTVGGKVSLMVGVLLMWLPIPWWKGSSLRPPLIPSHTPFNGSIKAKVFTSLLVVLSHFPLGRVIRMKFGVILCPWMHAVFFWEGLGFLIEG